MLGKLGCLCTERVYFRAILQLIPHFHRHGAEKSIRFLNLFSMTSIRGQRVKYFRKS